MTNECDYCRHLRASPVAAWMSVCARAIDGGELESAAVAARALRRLGVQVRLRPRARGPRPHSGRDAEGAGDAR
jgi:hypothetical protein